MDWRCVVLLLIWVTCSHCEDNEISTENSLAEDVEESIQCTRESEHAVVCDGITYEAIETLPVGSSKWFLFAGISVCLVLTAGLMSGLQLGLLSLDLNTLRVHMKAAETEKEQEAAKKILPLVQKHHLLMVTLLIVNAACMESLPLFLDELLSPFATIVVSVTAVLMFGEILPQAICSRYGLTIGAVMSPIVWLMVILTFLISYPISRVLDAVLGHGQGNFYRRNELVEMIRLQEDQGCGDQKLTTDERMIIEGAVAMKEKTVHNHFTAIEKVFMLDYDSTLDINALKEVQRLGHSRVPIYRARSQFGHSSSTTSSGETTPDGKRHVEKILGMILIKELIMIDPNEKTPVSKLHLMRMPTVPASTPLYHMLNMFRAGQSHMAIVVSSHDCITPLGVITLEDVLEELIQEDILDEDDYRKGTGLLTLGGALAKPRRRSSLLNTPAATPVTTAGGPETNFNVVVDSDKVGLL